MTPPFIHVELHCHTVFSKDGLITPENLVRTARKIGLHAIAITDHDTTEGAAEVERWVKQRGEGLQVMPGEERTLADGTHIIGLFLREPLMATDLEGVFKEIKAQGGLCLAPHPFRSKDGVFRHGLECLPLLRDHEVAFELFNAKSSAADNTRARDLLGKLHPFAGSDAHYESDLGESSNVVQWEGDLRTSIERMILGKTSCRLLGRQQPAAQAERAYVSTYYRVKKYARVPRVLLPAAKQAYRVYRNLSRGVGPKALGEVYAR